MNIDIGTPVLEVAIALSFVFFLLSLIVSTCTEGIALISKWRAKTLVKGIEGLLGDEQVSKAVLDHSLVQSDVRPGKKRDPSYVSARNFALALMRTVRKQGSQAVQAWDQVKEGVGEMSEDSPLGAQLKALLADAETDMNAFRKSVETWFDDAMDRVSGWYKRWAQVITCVIAVAVTVGLNVDAVRITERLATDPTVRTGVVTQAEAALQKPPATEAGGGGEAGASETTLVKAGENVEGAVKTLDSLNLPILWSDANDDVDLATAIGWLITAIAISLGAPFWFDTLSKLARLRATGKRPQSTPET